MPTLTASCEVRDLVLRARAGEPEAFGDLYGLYREGVYRYIYRRVGAHALAEDLTSETFVRALRRIALFTWQGTDFGAWLTTIARNLVADHFKSGRYRLELVVAELSEDGEVQDGDPEHIVLESLTRDALLYAVDLLGDEQKECVVLRFLGDLSVAETATVMGKNAGAVKALQYRAVRNLARLLPAET